jgi:replication fork protection complex subunit Tof1/Swi1
MHLVVKPDTNERKIAMFKNGHLRLLMSLAGLQQIGLNEDPDTSWIVPPVLTSDQLKQFVDLIKKYEFSPPVFDDGQEAEDFIRRKSASSAAKRHALDNEDGNVVESDEEELLFPAGGPTARRADALEQLKKTRRRRRKSNSGDEGEPSIMEEKRQQRAEERKARELEKLRKIKSDLFVHDSDDESDNERDRIFFEQEEKIRQRQKIAAMKELLGVGKSETQKNTERNSINMGRKRRAVNISSGSEESGSDSEKEGGVRTHGKSTRERTVTPFSSPHLRSSQTKRIRLSREGSQSQQESPAGDVNEEKMDHEISNVVGGIVHSQDEDEDAPVSKMARGRRHMAGFLIDSSDED